MRVKGQVKWWSDSKGYGFARMPNSDQDIFLHYSHIKTDGFQCLCEDQTIEFDLIDGVKGPQALNITKEVT